MDTDSVETKEMFRHPYSITGDELAARLDLPEAKSPLDRDIRLALRKLKISSNRAKALLGKLPLRIRQGHTGFTNASCGVVEDEDIPQVIIQYSQQKTFTSESEIDRWTRIEEFVHYLHIAINPTHAREWVSLRHTDQTIRSRYAIGASDAKLLMQANVVGMSEQAIEQFIKQSGLEAQYVSPSTVVEAAYASLGVTDNSSYERDEDPMNYRLSAGTAARLYKVLLDEHRDIAKAERLSEEELSRYTDSLAWYESKLASLADSDDVDRGKQDFYQREIRTYEQSLKYSVRRTVLQAIANGRMGEDDVQELFKKAGVPLDTVGSKRDTVEQIIASLPNTQLIEATRRHIRRSDISDRELLSLVAESQTHHAHFEEYMDVITNGWTGAYREMFKAAFDEELTSLDPQTLDEARRQALVRGLTGVFHHQQRGVVARAQLGVDILLFVDDLPSSDTPEGAAARSRMLNDPEWMRTQLEAMNDPSFGPLSPAGLTPEEFVADDVRARNATRDAVSKLYHGGDIDEQFANFLMLERGEIAYQLTLGGGDLPDEIEARYINDRDRIERAHPGASSSQVDAVQTHEATQLAKLEQDRDQARDLRQLLMEPIAKVVAVRILGKGVEDIPFRFNMLSYAPILSQEGNTPESGLRKWLVSLDLFLTRALSQDIEEFFRQDTYNAQRRVVQGVLNRR